MPFAAIQLTGSVEKMRPGDIITHSYEEITERLPVVDSSGKLHSFVLDAQQRGVLFDVGHGGAGFGLARLCLHFSKGLRQILLAPTCIDSA